MDDLNRLISEYKVAFGAGEGDPRPFLERAAPADRALLAALIDAFLEEAPRRDSAEHQGASRVTDEVQRTLAGTSEASATPRGRAAGGGSCRPRGLRGRTRERCSPARHTGSPPSRPAASSE